MPEIPLQLTPEDKIDKIAKDALQIIKPKLDEIKELLGEGPKPIPRNFNPITTFEQIDLLNIDIKLAKMEALEKADLLIINLPAGHQKELKQRFLDGMIIYKDRSDKEITAANENIGEMKKEKVVNHEKSLPQVLPSEPLPDYLKPFTSKFADKERGSREPQKD